MAIKMIILERARAILSEKDLGAPGSPTLGPGLEANPAVCVQPDVRPDLRKHDKC